MYSTICITSSLLRYFLHATLLLTLISVVSPSLGTTLLVDTNDTLVSTLHSSTNHNPSPLNQVNQQFGVAEEA